MGEQSSDVKEVTYSIAEVRDRLDEVLADEVSSFGKMNTDKAMMSYNLFTITSLLLIVEREKEMISSPDAGLELYDRENLFQELAELGIDVNKEMEACFEMLEKEEYLAKKNDKYDTNVKAYAHLASLNGMFPGMLGMNLVAYMLQLTEEAMTGRKTLQEAAEAFKQVLLTRGATGEPNKGAEYSAKKVTSEELEALANSKKLRVKLKGSYAKKLNKKTKGSSSFSSSTMNVKELFPKGPTEEELRKEAEKKREEAEKEAAAKLAAIEAEKIRLAEIEAKKKAAELEAREKRKEAELVAQETARKIKEMEEREAALIAKEAELAALEEERIKKAKEAKAKRQEEEEARRKAEEAAAELKAKEEEEARAKIKRAKEIEDDIVAFQQDLAMSCPVCNTGKIQSETTLKGKEYFSCSSEECRFVSWAKPFHFKCPACSNPFLVENPLPDGTKGLKCPRAACTYSQPNQSSPMEQSVVAPSATTTPTNGDKPKKRRIIRRRKK